MVAAKSRATHGEQKVPFNFRTGDRGWLWGGMVPDGDPGSVPHNRVRLAINVTFRKGQILARGGQREVNATPLHASDACVQLFDFPLGTPRQLVILGDGCPDISASVGFSASFMDHEQFPKFQPGVYYDLASVGVAAMVYGGGLYFGEDLSLRRYNSIGAPYGSTQLSLVGSGQDTLIHTFASGVNISHMLPFDGKGFIGVADGATSAVFFYDGLTIYDDEATLSDDVQRFALYRDKLILGFDGTPNEIQVRDVGGSAGTYVTVAPAAGTINFWRAVSYKDKLYITTLDQNLYVYDGSTLARILIGVTGLPVNANTWGIAEAFGNLYVAYEDADTAEGRLLQFDGTTWTPSVKNFTTQVPAATSARELILYRGDLVVVVRSTTTDALYTSPGSNVAGTWVATSQSASLSGSINDLVIY